MHLCLQLLCIFVILPNIVLLYLNRKRIHLKTMFVSLLVLFLIATLWDQLSVHMGLWTFFTKGNIRERLWITHRRISVFSLCAPSLHEHLSLSRGNFY